jgi:hypothetical protein
MGGERYRRGSYFAKATQDRRRAPAFRLFRSHSLAPVPNHPARRHGIRSRYSEPKGRASRNGRIFNRRLRRFAQIRKGYHARLKSIRYSEPQGRASRPRHAATRCDRRAAHTQGTVTPTPPIPPPIRHCGSCSRVARTFLSAHVHEGRQECLPHTLSLRYVKKAVSVPGHGDPAQRECLGRGADGGVSDREPVVSPRAARSRSCLRACGYWPGRNRSTRPHPHADGSRDVS